jgi:HEAT repeat protein
MNLLCSAGLLVLVSWYLVLPNQDIDTLLRDFKSDDAAVRDRAVQSALTRAAEWTPKDLQALRAASVAGDRDVAPRAKETLERIEIRRRAGPALLARFPNLDTMIRRGELQPCVAMLREVHRAIDEGTLKVADLDLLVDLMMARGVELEKEVMTLTFEEPHQPYARVLRPMLKSDDEHTVAFAIMRLARVGGKSDLPLILPFLKSDSSMLRDCAVSSFHEIPDRAVMEPIVPLLKDSNSDVRKSVIATLAGLPARDCIPLIVPLLKDDDAGMRRSAVWCLGEMGAIAEADAIAAMLKDRDIHVQEAAMEALLQIDAESHAKDIAPFLSHPDEGIQATAVFAYCRLDLKEALRKGKPLLDGPKESRWEAWQPFMGPEARDQAPVILPLLKHADSNVRGWAISALGDMEAPEHAPAIAALLPNLRAAHALGRLPLPKDRVDPAWVKQIREMEGEKTWELSVALLRLGGKSRQEQRDLADRMLRFRSYDTTAHYAALMRALGEVNEPATAAVLNRRFTLEKPVATRADLEALFEARGLKLKVPGGWDVHGRTAAGRDVSLYDLLRRHYHKDWHAIPEKEVVELQWWSKAFDYWLKRLK